MLLYESNFNIEWVTDDGTYLGKVTKLYSYLSWYNSSKSFNDKDGIFYASLNTKGWPL